MALISPGVEVTVTDESNYLSAPTNSVPLIVVATDQNKEIPAGTSIAAGTTAANANQVVLITSQRDLVNTYGRPFFVQASNGTPVHGHELNEYGLQAAYSVLGVSNRAYILRADVNLSEIESALTRPTATPADGVWWLDTSESSWGIFEWNAATGQFEVQAPIVITDDVNLTGGVPLVSIGSIGSYAVVATNTSNPIYYKNAANAWVLVGTDEWMASWATIRGTVVNPTLTSGNTIDINTSTVTLTGTDLATLASDINGAGITGVTAAVVAGKIEIYADSTSASDGVTADGAVDLQNNTGTILTDAGLTAGLYYAPAVAQSAHTVVPQWRSFNTVPRPTGSVWFKTTNVNEGLNLVVKEYSAEDAVFNVVTVPAYENDQSANRALDPAGGGIGIAAGSLYAQYDVNEDDTGTFRLYERVIAGETRITGSEINPTVSNSDQYSISVSDRNSNTLSAPVTVTIVGTTAADFVTAFLGAGITNVTAQVTSGGLVEIVHNEGGVIVLKNIAGTPLTDVGITASLTGVRTGNDLDLILSNWEVLDYTAGATAPGQNPADGTKWYYGAIDSFDIMVHDGAAWSGYKNVTTDARGFDLSATNPTGPILAASAPTQQSDGTALVHGDLWIDTSDLENFPLIRRWEDVDGVNAWVQINNADQSSENGIVFADARWDVDGTSDPITDPLTLITTLLLSDYVDIDAPDPVLYPTGTLLFNTRRSSYNVKQYKVDYFNATDFPDDTLPTVRDAWVTVNGNRSDGSPYMGRLAQRQVVVEALRSAIDTNSDIREEARQFNLIACPGYPELIPNMVALNNERNNTAFIIGDTPLRLKENGNDILNWANNTDGFGLQSADPYVGVFYPGCLTTDLLGNEIMQPASHMVLRSIIRSDEVSYPWIAPAGTRRGVVDNALVLGYLDTTENEFRQTGVRESIRDVLYDNRINALTFLPGVGIVLYGNKTIQGGLFNTSSLDRINVARLVAYLRFQLDRIGRQYIFEPNDQITRNEIKGQIERLLNEVTAKRGLGDYLVVCDESNNTPARIDRNELYVDIAIEPIKAVEFIYIPVRLQNTGSIRNGN